MGRNGGCPWAWANISSIMAGHNSGINGHQQGFCEQACPQQWLGLRLKTGAHGVPAFLSVSSGMSHGYQYGM